MPLLWVKAPPTVTVWLADCVTVTPTEMLMEATVTEEPMVQGLVLLENSTASPEPGAPPTPEFQLADVPKSPPDPPVQVWFEAWAAGRAARVAVSRMATDVSRCMWR